MSYQLMSWAVEQKTGSCTRKAVLLALADRANQDTGLCCPSIATIAEQTEMSEKTVQRALSDLVDAGLVTRERYRREDGSLGVYHYSFPRDRASIPADSLTGGLPDTESARNQELEPLTDTGTTANAVVPVGRAREPGDVALVYDFWRSQRGKTRASYDRISPKRRQKIETRLREFSPRDLMDAIVGVGRDPWADRHLHDDLTVIFRSREQVEKFLELAAGRGTNGKGTSIDAIRIAEAAVQAARGAPR